MAVTRFVDKIDPYTKQTSRYSRTYKADGTYDETKDRYLAPVYDIAKGDPGDVGPSNYVRALATGAITAGTTEAQYLASLQGQAGQSAPIYAAIAGSDFNLLVTGTTQLGTPPTGAAGTVFTVSGGDVYYTLTGTAPTSSSMPLADTTQVQVDPLSDAQTFRCMVKAGAPHLIGYWLKRTN